jgi:hypothetical protein
MQSQGPKLRSEVARVASSLISSSKMICMALRGTNDPGGVSLGTTDEFSPTVAISDRPHTQAGAIAGTVSYMSPDKRRRAHLSLKRQHRQYLDGATR